MIYGNQGLRYYSDLPFLSVFFFFLRDRNDLISHLIGLFLNSVFEFARLRLAASCAFWVFCSFTKTYILAIVQFLVSSYFSKTGVCSKTADYGE